MPCSSLTATPRRAATPPPSRRAAAAAAGFTALDGATAGRAGAVAGAGFGAPTLACTTALGLCAVSLGADCLAEAALARGFGFAADLTVLRAAAGCAAFFTALPAGLRTGRVTAAFFAGLVFFFTVAALLVLAAGFTFLLPRPDVPCFDFTMVPALDIVVGSRVL